MRENIHGFDGYGKQSVDGREKIGAEVRENPEKQVNRAMRLIPPENGDDLFGKKLITHKE